MFFLTLALAAEPNSDIVNSRLLRATPEKIAPALSDTRSIEELLPHRCAFDWKHGEHPYGPSDLMYNIKSFQRRLVVFLTVKKPNRLIEMDHLGNKGFITEFKLDPVGEATQVTITTYLNPPGWPMRKYYFSAVKPRWEQCYTEFLDRLQKRVE